MTAILPLFSYSTDDRGNRERVLSLLSDWQWHDANELRRVGGNRYGARVHELRGLGWTVECEGAKGHFRYRMTGRTEPKAKALSWKARALAAEAEVAQLREWKRKVSIAGHVDAVDWFGGGEA